MSIFYVPVKIISADGCLSSLGDEVERLGARNPLIITDPVIAKSGIIDKVTGPLKGKNIKHDVFEGVEPDPKIRNVTESAALAKKGRHDLLIGLGGGSSMDTAKGTSILAVNDIDLREIQGRRESYPVKPLPLMMIPTTAGTGSEISAAAVIEDVEKEYKMFISCPQIRAQVSFLDANVLAGIPSSIAASTGADALTHALESYLSPNRTFVSEVICLGSLDLIFSNLRAFVANTHNRERAQNMLNASCLAGVGMTISGLGLVHALAHPLGVKAKINHGMACALVLPHVLRFNWLADPSHYQRLALTMDWTIRLKHLNEREVVLQVIAEVENLLQDIGIPKRLSQIQVSISDTKSVVNEAVDSFLNQINPRLASREDLEQMMQQIL